MEVVYYYEPDDTPRIIFCSETYKDIHSRYPNGDVFKGSFKNGRREGSGVTTFANGNRRRGEWHKAWTHHTWINHTWTE